MRRGTSIAARPRVTCSTARQDESTAPVLWRRQAGGGDEAEAWRRRPSWPWRGEGEGAGLWSLVTTSRLAPHRPRLVLPSRGAN
ncbi:hypothetical protein E2C01_050451 [Portunus trituberculatus]|uniref:Uncharacterized protein n=1 Tax=Portunus trituberculatus TaxID=210409 RepID=A0A5B7G8B2_PORTR|nr:hypothetical protein [Portunus trituberculatus]